MADRLETIKNLMSVIYGSNQHYFSKDHLMKMLKLEKHEIRKNKIKKIFNG